MTKMFVLSSPYISLTNIQHDRNLDAKLKPCSILK